MKAIVLLFVRPPQIAKPAMQLSIVSGVANPLIGGDSKAALTNRGQTMPNESAPPFWTWFIENPRPVGQSVVAT